MVGNGRRVKFCKDLWCEELTSKEVSLSLFHLAVNKDDWVSEAWEEGEDLGSWSPCFSRHLNDWELGEEEALFRKLQLLVVRKEVEDVMS